MTPTKPCIVCDKELENVSVSEYNQPYQGTAFISQGHYGSTVFDPMDGSYLELNICDTCLVRLANENKILLARNVKRVVAYDYMDWAGPTTVGFKPVPYESCDWFPTTSFADSNFEIDGEDVGNKEKYPDIKWNVEE